MIRIKADGKFTPLQESHGRKPVDELRSGLLDPKIKCYERKLVVTL